MESHGYFLGSVEIKLIKFVDITDPNEGQLSAQMNNKIIEHIQREKRLMFSELGEVSAIIHLFGRLLSDIWFI